MKNVKKKIKILSSLFLLGLLVLCSKREGTIIIAKEPDANDIVQEMQIGWNLGKSLDCYDMEPIGYGNANYYEQLWHNPKTTKDIIHAVKKSGFGAVRIPVTYINHVDENGVIDPEWLARVAEVVDYVIDEGMYAIINVHHDTGKRSDAPIQADIAGYTTYSARAINLWQQIAEYFKYYDYHLLFEGYNETVDMSAKNPWYGNNSSWVTMNALNQLFVNTVRASGGNNINRFLIVNTYGAQATYDPLCYFEMPQDIIENHLIVGVHSYYSSQSGVASVMKCLDATILKKGYPCILGEWAINCMGKDCQTQAANMLVECEKRGITCFWWDDGGAFKLLDRKKCQWYNPELVSAMIYLTTGKIIDENEAVKKEVIVDNSYRYKALDYIDITSTGCNFQTDVALSSDLKMELTVATTGNYYGNLMAAGSGSTKLMFRQEGKKGIYAAYGWYNSAVVMPEMQEVFTITQEQNKTYVNGVLVRTAKEQRFASNECISIGEIPCRIYSCKIWDGQGSLIHDYVPAYDNKMEACLYDKVCQKFIYSSGTCSAGNVVTVVR